MIRLIRSNLAALPTPIVPFGFTALRTVPEGMLVALFRRFLRSSVADPLKTSTPAVAGELDILAAQLGALERPPG
ncbi:hypothetical protein BH11ACT4_BH11ACT4_06480 [soil metagenome]